MRRTSAAWALDQAELATTAVAVVASTGLYLAQGFPYLARGVVGDCVGFIVLAVPLLARGARCRHEALVCLAGIGLVHVLGWDWPLALPEATWWGVITVALGGYLALRRWALRPSTGGPDRPTLQPGDVPRGEVP
jgi:hypothetical protein